MTHTFFQVIDPFIVPLMAIPRTECPSTASILQATRSLFRRRSKKCSTSTKSMSFSMVTFTLMVIYESFWSVPFTHDNPHADSVLGSQKKLSSLQEQTRRKFCESCRSHQHCRWLRRGKVRVGCGVDIIFVLFVFVLRIHSQYSSFVFAIVLVFVELRGVRRRQRRWLDSAAAWVE